MDRTEINLGKLIKERRTSIPMTLAELASMCGISQSHLGRIERGERFPSGHVLQKLAGPLGFEESELFVLVGFLSESFIDDIEPLDQSHFPKGLDPVVAQALACETVEVQRAVIGILSLLKSASFKTLKKQG